MTTYTLIFPWNYHCFIPIRSLSYSPSISKSSSLLAELMKKSHFLYRDDLETSCEEMDFLVDLANNSPRVLEARMTGGGFGRCTVTIVRAGCVHKLMRGIRKTFMKKYEMRDISYTCILFITLASQ